MDLTALKAQIKSGNLNSYYIFTGPEIEVMRLYMVQMAKVKNATVKNLESITELGQKMHTRQVVRNACLYVVRDSKEFMSDEALQAKVAYPGALGNDLVVFVYTSIDKRSRLYKNHESEIVEFLPLKDDILVNYIQRRIKLGTQKCLELIGICESDYSRILLEIDKIQAYVDANTVNNEPILSPDKAMDELLEAGAIYQPPYDAVFDFVDAVLRDQRERAFNLLQQSYESGEATMVLLSNLYNSAKQLLQVQSFDGNGKITEVTGLTPFQVKLASGRKGHNSNGDLVYLMNLTRGAEKGIKVGEIEERLAIEFILINFWRD